MEFGYAISSFGLTTAVEMLALPILFHMRSSRAAASGALGIMIFTCVKIIVIQCGWGFAALFGTVMGMCAEIFILCTSIFFFHEVKLLNKKKCSVKPVARPSFGVVAGIALCFALGCDLAHSPNDASDYKIYVISKSIYIGAVIASLAFVCYERDTKWCMTIFFTVEIIRAAIVYLCRPLSIENEVTAPFLLAVGAAGILCEFADHIEVKMTSSKEFLCGIIIAILCGMCFE